MSEIKVQIGSQVVAKTGGGGSVDPEDIVNEVNKVLTEKGIETSVSNNSDEIKAIQEQLAKVDTDLNSKVDSDALNTAIAENSITKAGSVSITNLEAKQAALENINNRAAVVNSETNAVESLGYKVLDASKTFAEQVTEANTIYEVRDMFDFGGGSVDMPANCTLDFKGGSIANGNLNANGTRLINLVDIKEDLILRGRVDVPLNIDWFGAKRNDETFDSAPAIQRAIDAGFSSGNKTEVVVPVGTYYIASPLVFKQGSVYFHGESTASKIKAMAEMDYMMVDHAYVNNTKSYTSVRISDLSLDGNRTGDYRSRQEPYVFYDTAVILAKGGIYFPRYYYTDMFNVNISNIDGIAIYTEHTYVVSYRNIRFYYCKVGMWSTLPNGIMLTQCEFNSIRNYGVVFQSGHNVVLLGTNFEVLGGSAIRAGAIPSLLVVACYFEKCSLEGVSLTDYYGQVEPTKIHAEILLTARVNSQETKIQAGGPFLPTALIWRNDFQPEYADDMDKYLVVATSAKALKIDSNVASKDCTALGIVLGSGTQFTNVEIGKNYYQYTDTDDASRSAAVPILPVKVIEEFGFGYRKVEIKTNSDRLLDTEDLTDKFVISTLSDYGFTQLDERKDGRRVFQAPEDRDPTLVFTTVADSGIEAGTPILVQYDYQAEGSETWNTRYIYGVAPNINIGYDRRLRANTKFTQPIIKTLTSAVTKFDNDMPITVASSASLINISYVDGEKLKFASDPVYKSAIVQNGGLVKIPKTHVEMSSGGLLADRPTLSGDYVGFRYYATDVHKWITWDGGAWYYDDATAVE